MKIPRSLIQRASEAGVQKVVLDWLATPGRTVEELVLEHFDWGYWVLENLFPDLARKAYREALAPALNVYQEATALGWKAYQEAEAAALKAHQEAKVLAGKSYKEATALALAEALNGVIRKLPEGKR